MPYERQWSTDVEEPCDPQEWFTDLEMRTGRDGEPDMVPVQRRRTCSKCFGRGVRKVGGWVTVWVDPGPPV